MQNDRALFLYGFDVTATNQFINFKAASTGAVLTAIIPQGNYTATELMAAIVSAMSIMDTANTYAVSMNRNVDAGMSNSVTITTSGSYLQIYFGTGDNTANSIANLIGFPAVDLTGATAYTSPGQAGKILIPTFPTYNYLGPDSYVVNDGSKSVSASGIKETLVFAQMLFLQGQWRYITDFGTSTQLTEWQNYLKYATRQLKHEITPSIYESTTTFYPVTLETTLADGNGMSFTLQQMLSDGLYRFYDTGIMKYRIIPE